MRSHFLVHLGECIIDKTAYLACSTHSTLAGRTLTGSFFIVIVIPHWTGTGKVWTAVCKIGVKLTIS